MLIGFAIVQFFERLQQAPEARSAYLPNAPIYLGLALIGCGVLPLVVAIWEYRWALHYLWGQPFTPIAGTAGEPMNTPVLAIGVLLIFIGLFAFIAVSCASPEARTQNPVYSQKTRPSPIS